MLTAPLRAAYLSAIYRFDAGRQPLELRMGQHNAALHDWLREGSHLSATVLTAFNPGSRTCSGQFNDTAQQQLRDVVQSRGLTFIEGRNLDPAGVWPPEHSLLIADLSLADSREMARRFGQLAFLWSDTAVPQLHITDAEQDLIRP